MAEKENDGLDVGGRDEVGRLGREIGEIVGFDRLLEAV